MSKQKQDNNLVIVLIAVIVILLFGGFGMMGFSGFGMMNMMSGYGNSYLCSNVGGIWCYWPNFAFIFMILFWIVIILLVVWIVKQLQRSNHRRGNKW